MKKFKVKIHEFITEADSEKEIESRLSEIGKIFNSTLAIGVTDILEQDINGLDKVTDRKITMRNLKDFFGNSSRMKILKDESINWRDICRIYLLTEAVIRTFDAKIDFNEIANRFNNGDYKFSQDFIAEYGNLIENYNPFSHTIPQTVKTPPYKEPQNKVDINLLKENIKEERQSSDDIINDIKSVLKDAFGVSGNEIEVFAVGAKELPEVSGEYLIKEEDIYNTPITVENFPKITMITEDKMEYWFSDSPDMSIDLSSNCILTKEFIFKYEKYISFEYLIGNKKCFNKLMADEEFFDRYIDKIIKIKNNKMRINHPIEGEIQGTIISLDFKNKRRS